MFQRSTEYAIVGPAHMELAEPTIEMAFDRCVERGAIAVGDEVELLHVSSFLLESFDPTTGELLTLVRLAPAPAITGPAADPTILRLDPHHDRLVGGPTHTKVYDPHDRRVNASCDICNRRLGIGEPWWMVASPNRDWVNGMGVVCADHRPWLLPHDTVAARDDA